MRIITVSREFGNDGRGMGKRMADELDIALEKTFDMMDGEIHGHTLID